MTPSSLIARTEQAVGRKETNQGSQIKKDLLHHMWHAHCSSCAPVNQSLLPAVLLRLLSSFLVLVSIIRIFSLSAQNTEKAHSIWSFKESSFSGKSAAYSSSKSLPVFVWFFGWKECQHISFICFALSMKGSRMQRISFICFALYVNGWRLKKEDLVLSTLYWIEKRK